jgi:hypothetical protein
MSRNKRKNSTARKRSQVSACGDVVGSRSTTLHQQKGIGYLSLKDGTVSQVQWEIDLHGDGALGLGRLRGGEKHLAVAVEDGCAHLLLTASHTAAITIDGYEDGEVSFAIQLIFQSIKTWQTGTFTGHGFVYAKFNDSDPPLALSPDGARKLAAELIERAGQVETQLQTAH